MTSLGASSFAKIFDCVAKVEKLYRPRPRDGTTATVHLSLYRGNRGRNSRDFPRNLGQALSYFYRGKQSHFKRWCDTRKRDLNMQEKDGASQSATK